MLSQETVIWRSALLGAALSAAVVGCAKNPPASQTPDAAGQQTSYEFSNNWGNGPGCTPRGGPLSLTGKIAVRPFGKGTDGALLVTESDEWVVSYRAEGALLELRGKKVRARGRACEKQGEAVAGKHFDLESLNEVQ